jgi:hypothetical protein
MLGKLSSTELHPQPTTPHGVLSWQSGQPVICGGGGTLWISEMRNKRLISNKREWGCKDEVTLSVRHPRGVASEPGTTAGWANRRM